MFALGQVGSERAVNSNRTQTFLHSDFVFNWLKLSRSSGRDERALDGGSCVTGRNVAETLMRLYCTTIKKHCLRGLRTGKTQVETLIDEFIRLAAGIDRRCAFDQAVRGLCSQMLLLFFWVEDQERRRTKSDDCHWPEIVGRQESVPR